MAWRTFFGSVAPPVILLELTPHLLRRAGTSSTEVAKHLVFGWVHLVCGQ